jgi:hypothetical protein
VSARDERWQNNRYHILLARRATTADGLNVEMGGMGH